jgi:hypothetical protein
MTALKPSQRGREREGGREGGREEEGVPKDIDIPGQNIKIGVCTRLRQPLTSS